MTFLHLMVSRPGSLAREEAGGKGSTGRDSGSALARPVQLQNEKIKIIDFCGAK
jgi:hypothetical protein